MSSLVPVGPALKGRRQAHSAWLQVLEAIRGTGDATPVLILSALGDTEERVRGLRAGSDDYLAKPFHNSLRVYTSAQRRSRL